jgi:hypothetical protein
MKQNKIKDLPKLVIENLENIFEIYTDKDDFYYYNLLQTINVPLDLPPGYYNNYTIMYNDTWPYISYKNYKTPNLWWIILAANNINNPTQIPDQGTTIKIIKPTFVKTMLLEIQQQTK